MAAELLGHGKYNWTQLPTGPYAELRRAHETYQQLRDQTAQQKNQLTTALDGLFPEFQRVFRAVDGQTALTILRTCANPAVIASLDQNQLLELIRANHGGRRLMCGKLCELRHLAAQSIGLSACASALTEQVRRMAEHLAFLMEQRQEAERYVTDLFLSFDESAFLLSIPGLGKLNAAGLLAHLGNVRHFSGVKQWSKLAGIVPQENTSADHRAARTPMSKKGRRGLRAVLWRACVCLNRNSAVFRRYIQRLCNRSAKDHPLKKREAIGAAMNKLLRIAYALLSKREMFDEAKAVR